MPWKCLVSWFPDQVSWRKANLSENSLSLDGSASLFQNCGGSNRLDEKLRLSTFDHHDFPELLEAENRFSTGGIDGPSLRLVKDNHFERGIWMEARFVREKFEWRVSKASWPSFASSMDTSIVTQQEGTPGHWSCLGR